MCTFKRNPQPWPQATYISFTACQYRPCARLQDLPLESHHRPTGCSAHAAVKLLRSDCCHLAHGAGPTTRRCCVLIKPRQVRGSEGHAGTAAVSLRRLPTVLQRASVTASDFVEHATLPGQPYFERSEPAPPPSRRSRRRRRRQGGAEYTRRRSRCPYIGQVGVTLTPTLNLLGTYHDATRRRRCVWRSPRHSESGHAAQSTASWHCIRCATASGCGCCASRAALPSSRLGLGQGLGIG